MNLFIIICFKFCCMICLFLITFKDFIVIVFLLHFFFVLRLWGENGANDLNFVVVVNMATMHGQWYFATSFMHLITWSKILFLKIRAFYFSSILESPVTEDDFKEQLHELNHKINFVKEQSFRDARACLDVKDILEKLKVKVSINQNTETLLFNCYIN